MIVVADDLSVCTDCAVYIANGELPDDPKYAALVLAGERREAPARWVVTGEVSFFDWRTCDCCASGLGGMRLAAALLGAGHGAQL